MKTQLSLLVCYGCPSSFGEVASRIIGCGPVSFLCALQPGESSQAIKGVWNFTVQPIDQSLSLFIIYEQSKRSYDGVMEFAVELARTRNADLDILLLSDDSSWSGSRRLASELKQLQHRFDQLELNCVARRI